MNLCLEGHVAEISRIRDDAAARIATLAQSEAVLKERIVWLEKNETRHLELIASLQTESKDLLARVFYLANADPERYGRADPPSSEDDEEKVAASRTMKGFLNNARSQAAQQDQQFDDARMKLSLGITKEAHSGATQ